MKGIITILSLLLTLTMLVSCGQSNTQAPHSIDFAGLEEVDVGNDDISGYFKIRGIKYRGYCTPCYNEEPDQGLGPVIAYWECPGLEVGWQYVAEIQGVDPENSLLLLYEDGTGEPSWGSGAEILVADDVKEIPRWIEDMRERYINSTMPGTYTGPEEGFTILEE